MLLKESKTKIWKKLKKRPLENIETIKTIEKFFLKERGYVFKMPKPGENVILLLSGGSDSIVLWDILMSEYKLNVYPLFITEKKGLFRWIDHQYISIKYFEKYYGKKYKKIFHPKFTVSMGNILRKKILKYTLKNPTEMLNNVYEDGSINITNYSTTSLLANASLDYSQLLQAKKNINTKTIFTANLATDGEIIQNQTLTSLRSIMFNICNISGNYDKQFTSLFLEKELGYFFSKNFIVKWAKTHNIPIKKTWTCWKKNGIIACGSCIACQYRKEVMHKNRLNDSLYASDIKKWLLTVKNKITKLTSIGYNLWKGKK